MSYNRFATRIKARKIDKPVTYLNFYASVCLSLNLALPSKPCARSCEAQLTLAVMTWHF